MRPTRARREIAAFRFALPMNASVTIELGQVVGSFDGGLACVNLDWWPSNKCVATCNTAAVPLPPSEKVDGARAIREATRISANVCTLATRRSRRISRCRRAAGVTFAHDARSR